MNSTLKALKHQQIISIRDFVRSIAKITDHPGKKIYTIVKNGHKVGTFIPTDMEEDLYKDYDGYIPPQKKYDSLLVFDDELSFSAEPDLSQRIDEIVYGVAKPEADEK